MSSPPKPEDESTGPRQDTLPPSEWAPPAPVRSATSVALEGRRERPVARRSGAVAEHAQLRAQLAFAQRSHDIDEERARAAGLARALAARGSELDEATRLARRSLVLGDDPALREELSGWFAGLGEPALAAATLRPLLDRLSGIEAARTRSRIAVLHARAGNAVAAAELFAEAAQEAAEDPNPPELLGAIGAWDAAAVPAPRAANAYVEGSRRHFARGEKAAAFEDLLRAFEIDPSSPLAAEQLAATLVDGGRSGAADEVMRTHAEAAPDAAARVHLRRMRDAVERDELGSAIGAALDARLESRLDLGAALATVGNLLDPTPQPPALSFDALLARAGLLELLAARLKLAIDALPPERRGEPLLALGQLYEGPLASPDRAADAWINAVVAEPSSDAARLALRDHAIASRDQMPLVEAYVRVALGEAAESAKRSCLEELIQLAEQRLSDPSLALWAAQRLVAIDSTSTSARDAIERLEPRARMQGETLARARAELSNCQEAADRLQPLRTVAAVLRGRPDQADEFVACLRELAAGARAERWALTLERVLYRLNRVSDVEAVLRATLEDDPDRAELERVRLRLSEIQFARGDLDAALAELAPLVEDPGACISAWSRALVLAGQAGNERMRGQVLLRLAAALPPDQKAVFCSVAADAFRQVGDGDAAFAAASAASRAEPSLARPVATLAKCVVGRNDRVAIAALERAVSIVVPRSELCRALIDALESQGEESLAVAWTQRWLALRPGDPRAAQELVERVTRIQDAARLGDALLWLLAQAMPLGRLVVPLSEGLRRVAQLAPKRGGSLARRALDVFGPRDAKLCDAILWVADHVGERGLAIAVLERRLASGAGEERGDLLLDVAARRRAAGDADGAARALARAALENVPPDDLLAAVEQALPPRGSDGEIALLSARAEALAALSGADPAGTSQAFRELGAALWDLAGDADGASAAWERAALVGSDGALARLASDLVNFAGPQEAVRRLVDFAQRRQTAPEQAGTLAEAAAIALQCGDRAGAFLHASRAVELDPARPEPLALAERSADAVDVERLESLYYLAANGAMGCYGERAVHYRAARQLERRGALERALDHSVAAFEAVPAEGVTFVLMARLAERANDVGLAVGAVERVAEKVKNPERRAHWLQRAARLAGDDEQGVEQRVEVLLRALAVSADIRTVTALGEAITLLVGMDGLQRESLTVRFERSLRSVLPRIDEAQAVEMADRLGRVAVEALEAPEFAAPALLRALFLAPAARGYDRMADWAIQLGDQTDVVLKAVDDNPNAGRSLLELAAAIADGTGDARRATALLVRAAAIDPDDAEFAQRVVERARASGDSQQLRLALEVVPPQRRAQTLLQEAGGARDSGDLEAEIEALEQVRVTPGLEPHVLAQVFERLSSLLAESGRRDQLGELLSSELEREDLERHERVRIGRDLAALAAARGKPLQAIEVLEGLEELMSPRIYFEDMLSYGRQADSHRLMIRALTRLVDLTSDVSHKVDLMRELARTLQSEGDDAGATSRYEELLVLAPADDEALLALEKEAAKRDDYERMTTLLQRRAELADSVSEVRRLRMRRARLLEGELGRPDDAIAELEALVVTTGDDREALRQLAELHERRGAPARAAPLWLRASGTATDKHEAADFTRRACEAYLEGGDVDAARRVLDGLETWARSAEMQQLRVDVERRSNNPRALAEALEELALASMDPAPKRASLLVEAARASYAGGDEAAALARAQRAARIAPSMSAPQLLARLLEFRERGSGSSEDARITVSELMGIDEELTAEETALRAFLVSQAYERIGSHDNARRVLSVAHAELGSSPLVSLAMAARLAEDGQPGRSLMFYDVALGGDLRGVRQAGEVALEAAQAAIHAGRYELASTYIERAASDPNHRDAALTMQSQLQSFVAGASQVTAEQVTAEAAPATPRASQPKPPSRPAAAVAEALAGPPSSAPGAPKSDPSGPPSDPPPRSHMLSSGSHLAVSARAWVAPRDADEAKLLAELEEGSSEAGRALLDRYAGAPGRQNDTLRVCRQLAVMHPTDEWTLSRLAEAAAADGDATYAEAVRHVRAALNPAHESVAPPDIDLQRQQPDSVHELIFRGVANPGTEALAIVWEAAQHVFRRDPSTYGVTGLERVALGSPTPVGRVYGGVARLLGLTRTPLFQRRSAGAVTVSVALLTPPSLIISGEVRRESSALAFHIGAMLAATLPRHVLLYGSTETQARGVLDGLSLAFGPPEKSDGNLGSVAALAELLWDTISARSQRRLRELCDDPGAVTYEVAFKAARLAVRRAGLLASGDLSVALREMCVDEGVESQVLDSAEGIAELCRTSDQAADLVALATSPEYADARWQSPRRRGNP